MCDLDQIMSEPRYPMREKDIENRPEAISFRVAYLDQIDTFICDFIDFTQVNLDEFIACRDQGRR
jgi:hypothetical protein